MPFVGTILFITYDFGVAISLLVLVIGLIPFLVIAF
jgi:hypothetical protein